MQRILVIEDNEQNMYLTTFLLENAGFEVLQAEDGVAGIDLAESRRPDLILLDIQLPKMDGHEVARRLTANPVTEAIPIVAVTSYAMVGDRQKSIEAGCTGYIEKPIDPETFVDDVKRHLPPAAADGGSLPDAAGSSETTGDE